MAAGTKAAELREISDEELISRLREAKEALTRAVHKLPMKCRIVRREGGEA